MENPAQFDKKVYAATSASAISMRELLQYFTQHGGSMRVSDLHLKAVRRRCTGLMDAWCS